ncbi:MAG: HYR domain-containing protein, partial [Saprospiraceae bacterium]
DANGCSTTVSFNIMATDNQPPALICPDNIQKCGESIVNYGLPGVSDNCGVAGPAAVIAGLPSGSVFQEGMHTIIYRATDVTGNSGTCSFSIVVHQVPVVSFDNVSNDVNGQGVGQILISVTGHGPFQFFWTKNGQPFADTEDLTNLSEGTYSLEIHDINGCISIVGATISNTVGINEPGLSGSVRLWPNPMHSTIQLEIIDLDVIAACVVDLRGSLVKEIQPSELSGEIDLEALPGGMYCLKITATNGRVMSLKFVKAGN